MALKGSYSDAFTVEKLNLKHVILNVQKHLILEILFVSKSMVKPFYYDLKRKMKITQNPRPISSRFKNVSDTGANIVANARTL